MNDLIQDHIRYVETPHYIFTHKEVWYKDKRIGSLNYIADEWSFLSYPNSETTFYSPSLSSIENQINLHREALLTESLKD